MNVEQIQSWFVIGCALALLGAFAAAAIPVMMFG